jgi:hypothetical protein
MKGFVFTFDILLGLLSISYLSLFLFSAPNQIQEFIFDFSVFRRVSDVLITLNSYEPKNQLNYTTLINNDSCFPLENPCDEEKEWICGEWRKSVLIDENIEFKPIILCMEGLN